MRYRLEHGVLDLDQGVIEREHVVGLTPVELALLRHLAASAPDPVAHDDALLAVWGLDPSSGSRAARVAVRRLRAKLEVDPSAPVHLVTVRGAGYALRVEPERDARLHPTHRPGPLRGREGVVAAVQSALTGHRQATVLGAPGIGKSHLAHAVVADWAGPVGWFELESARDLEGALTVLASAVGAGVGEGRHLGAVLSERVDLLVLDGVESIVEDLSRVIQHWLDQSAIRVLATSRRPLGLRAERRFELPPLTPIASSRVFEDLTGLQVPAESALITRCEGLPLAIVLSARQAGGVRGPDASSISDPVKQALVRSWELLARPEREALCACATFADPFTVDQARSLLGDEAPARLHQLRLHGLLEWRGERLRLLQSLGEAVVGLAGEMVRPHAVRHATVHADRALAHADGFFGPDRGHHLAAVFALRGKLERTMATLIEEDPDRAAAVLAPYVYSVRARAGGSGATWIRRVAEAVGDRTTPEALVARSLALEQQPGPEGSKGLRELLDLAVSLGHDAVAARVASRLVRRLILAGAFDDAEVVLSEATERPAPPAMRARLHLGRAKIARARGAPIADPIHQAEEALGDVNDPYLRGELRLSLARLAQDRGDLVEARARFEEALAIGRQEGDRATLLPLSGLANLALTAGDLDAAIHGFVKVGAIARRLGQGRALSIARVREALARVERGGPDADESLRVARQVVGPGASPEIQAALLAGDFLRALDRGDDAACEQTLAAMDRLDLPEARDLERRYWAMLLAWTQGTPVDLSLADALDAHGQGHFTWGLLALAALDGTDGVEARLRRQHSVRASPLYRAMLDWARARRNGEPPPARVTEGTQTGVLLRMALRRLGQRVHQT